MHLSQLSNILSRIEAISSDPWDTIIDETGRIAVKANTDQVVADNIAIEDAWFISQAPEDIKLLMNEVLDLRKLIYDIHLMLEEREDSSIITKYIEMVMGARVG
jgi:hypothetical protein